MYTYCAANVYIFTVLNISQQQTHEAISQLHHDTFNYMALMKDNLCQSANRRSSIDRRSCIRRSFNKNSWRADCPHARAGECDSDMIGCAEVSSFLQHGGVSCGSDDVDDIPVDFGVTELNVCVFLYNGDRTPDVATPSPEPSSLTDRVLENKHVSYAMFVTSNTMSDVFLLAVKEVTKLGKGICDSIIYVHPKDHGQLSSEQIKLLVSHNVAVHMMQ